MTAPALNDFIKAYDVRGLVPDQLSPRVARELGAAFAQVVVRPEGANAIVVGHDMRPSSPELSRAFADGAAAYGVDVTLIGLCSTDGLYFASGALDLPGAMFTASHNPAQYNGIKLCRAGARPVSLDTGLAEIRDLAQWALDRGQGVPFDGPAGSVTEREMLREYAEFLRGLVDLSGGRPLKVVVDAGNGMGGHTVPAVLGTDAGLAQLPLDIVPLYFELDGTFPNHEANPLEPANLVDLQQAVVEHLGTWATWPMAVLIFVLVFSTVLGCYSYTQVNVNFLGGEHRAEQLLGIVLTAASFAGTVLTLPIVWALTDIALGVLGIINLVAIVRLAPWALGALRDFEAQRAAGVADPVFVGHGNPLLPGDTADGVWEARPHGGARQAAPTTSTQA